MTGTLADAVDRIEFPTVPGISARALSEVLSRMARIARVDGTFRYGLRASKVAVLVKYSIRVVRRAQAWLVEHGYLEKVQIGGGRASTHWRVLLDKLAEHLPKPGSGHGSSEPESPLRRFRGTALGRGPDSPGLLFRRSRPAPPAPLVLAPLTDLCEEHGSIGGVLPDGRPRCPGCRRLAERLRF